MEVMSDPHNTFLVVGIGIFYVAIYLWLLFAEDHKLQIANLFELANVFPFFLQQRDDTQQLVDHSCQRSSKKSGGVCYAGSVGEAKFDEHVAMSQAVNQLAEDLAWHLFKLGSNWNALFNPLLDLLG